MNTLFWLMGFAALALLLLRSRGASPSRLKALAARHAQRVDVRTPGEYQQGHAPETVNIPLDQLSARAQELDPMRPVLVCCASGSRSAIGASLLRRKGFEAVNAGPWQRLVSRS